MEGTGVHNPSLKAHESLSDTTVGGFCFFFFFFRGGGGKGEGDGGGLTLVASRKAKDRHCTDYAKDIMRQHSDYLALRGIWPEESQAGAGCGENELVFCTGELAKHGLGDGCRRLDGEGV